MNRPFWQGAKVIAGKSHKTLIGTVLLFFFDAILANQGAISAAVGIFVLFISFPRALFDRDRALRALRLKKGVIWLIAVIGVFAFNRASNEMAHQRANDVIVAVKAYHQQHGVYPKRLDDLVPAHFPAVPRAKYVLFMGEFKYLYDEANPVLFYVEVPPFGRPTYSFERDEWGYQD